MHHLKKKVKRFSKINSGSQSGNSYDSTNVSANTNKTQHYSNRPRSRGKHNVRFNKNYYKQNDDEIKHLIVSDETIIIDEPGHYILDDDFIFVPTADVQAAIIIEVDNVVLDLAGHCISQSEDTFDKFHLIVGIDVQPDCNNIEITNGTIKNFSGIGIFLNYDPALPTDVIQHENIILSNLLVKNIGRTDLNSYIEDNSGILVAFSQNVRIFKCKFSLIRASVEASAIGIYFSSDIVINKVTITKVTIETNSFGLYGILAENCQNIVIDFFDTSNFFITNGVDSQYQQSLGIFLVSTTPVFISNGTITKHYANRFAGIAIQDEEPNNNNRTQSIIKNITVENNRAEVTVQGLILFNMINVLVENIIIQDNILERSSGNNFQFDFYDMTGIDVLSSQDIYVEKCLATRNYTKTPKPFDSIYSVCCGFAVTPIFQDFSLRCSNITYKDCVATKNTTYPGVTGVRIIGGWIIFNTDNIILTNCVASCHFSDDADAEVYGFNIADIPYFPNQVNNVELNQCVAKCNLNVANQDNSGPIIIGRSDPLGTVSALILRNNCLGE